MTPTRLLLLAALAAGIAPMTRIPGAPPRPAAPAPGKIDFDADVQPILAAHCLKCHGPEKQKGSFRLDTRKAALEGGDTGAVLVPGKSDRSRLFQLVAGQVPDSRMPPAPNKPLTAEQIAKLRAWIDQGADYGTANTGPTTSVKSTHWAFQPIRRPPVPVVRNAGFRVRNAIDNFVLARLEKEGLTPSPEADRATLIRRVSLDLTGLPPTPAEVDAFLKDTRPDAYEKVVDRLLASPHYGERWGRHWLDSARYADSDGYEKDTGRPFAWRYRDWVIQALNNDMPFDRFTIEQLAGDLLPNATIEQRIATGFHRNTLTNKEGGIDQEEFRVAAVIDRVNTTGKVWLGLTIGCCQCHDHKYDPISQREFYQFAAFFNSDRETDIAAPLPGEEARHKAAQAAHDAEKAKLKSAADEAKTKHLPNAELKKRLAALAAHLKKAPSTSKAMILTLGPTRPTHVLIRGDFLRKGVEVKPGTPAVLRSGVRTDSRTPRTRLDLAKWLVSADNPLTARVMANWIWAKYFGRGIVATPEDFGTQGEKPSHPELLDWLATEFMQPASGGSPTSAWSMKRLHRLIVTSSTYRQSSVVRPELLRHDPLNVLLARQSRLRLEAEIVRDGALAASGLLNRTIGGPSIRPPQPAGISELTYANSARWTETTGPDRYKRGMYIWFQRTSPYPMLTAFDAPDSNVCVVRRERSNTPLQALTLLNDTVFVECAQALANRVLTEKNGNPDAARVVYLMRLCVGRPVTDAERDRLIELLADFRALAAKNPAAAAKLVGQHRPPGGDAAEAAAWVALARTVLNLDECVTRE